jgi:hypothetical protein
MERSFKDVVNYKLFTLTYVKPILLKLSKLSRTTTNPSASMRKVNGIVLSSEQRITIERETKNNKEWKGKGSQVSEYKHIHIHDSQTNPLKTTYIWVTHTILLMTVKKRTT